jgi:hypothetical protein
MTKKKRLTRGEAIRAKCLDCSGDIAKEVRLCPCTDCALFPYRMGVEVKNTEHATEKMTKKG